MSKLKSHSLTLSLTLSWHAEHLLISCLCSKVTLSLSHALTIDMICLCSKVTLTLSLSHSPTHSVSLNMLNNFCFHIFAQKSLSHSHTLTLSHSHILTLTLSQSFSLSLSHSLTLDNVKGLSWSLAHAKQLLFSCLCFQVNVYSRKIQCFFGPQHPVSLEFVELVPS